jgi:hypothetical protein
VSQGRGLVNAKRSFNKSFPPSYSSSKIAGSAMPIAFCRRICLPTALPDVLMVRQGK